MPPLGSVGTPNPTGISTKGDLYTYIQAVEFFSYLGWSSTCLYITCVINLKSSLLEETRKKDGLCLTLGHEQGWDWWLLPPHWVSTMILPGWMSPPWEWLPPREHAQTLGPGRDSARRPPSPSSPETVQQSVHAWKKKTLQVSNPFCVKQLTMAIFTGPHDTLTDQRENPKIDEGSGDEIRRKTDTSCSWSMSEDLSRLSSFYIRDFGMGLEDTMTWAEPVPITKLRNA